MFALKDLAAPPRNPASLPEHPLLKTEKRVRYRSVLKGGGFLLCNGIGRNLLYNVPA
jgi:hypothetical protein